MQSMQQARRLVKSQATASCVSWQGCLPDEAAGAEGASQGAAQVRALRALVAQRGVRQRRALVRGVLAGGAE